MNEKTQKNMLETGTSLVGIVCKDGIVMAGDRKITAGGQLTIGKNFKKVDQINNYLIISTTGSVSDNEMLKKIVKAELKLKELKEKKRPTIKEGANLIGMVLYRNIRQPSMIPFMAGVLVGGFNEDGTTELYTIEPAGSVIKVEDYDANFSSGMPYILGLLERTYKKNISVEEGIKLAIEAIKSSSERDTASGCGIDVFTITKKGIQQTVKQKAEANYTEQTI